MATKMIILMILATVVTIFLMRALTKDPKKK